QVPARHRRHERARHARPARGRPVLAHRVQRGRWRSRSLDGVYGHLSVLRQRPTRSDARQELSRQLLRPGADPMHVKGIRTMRKIVMLTVLFHSLAAHAAVTGKIEGIVTDKATKKPLAGVTVVVSGPALQGEQADFT